MPPDPALTLLVAEELALVRDGIAALCEQSGLTRVVGVASDGQKALRMIRDLKPSLCLLDLYLPGLDAIEILKSLELEGSLTRCAIISDRRDRKTVLEVLRAGAAGYLLLSSCGAEQVQECLLQISRGVVYIPSELDPQSLFAPGNRSLESDPLANLSAREVQVFNLLIAGVRAKEIAARLHLSPKTVDTYRSSLMRKLEIYDVAGLVRFAVQNNLLPPWSRPHAAGAASGL
jgi:DNA-binding NarL/FixJ family response regulator